MPDWLANAAHRWPNRVFIETPEEALTFGELDRRVPKPHLPMLIEAATTVSCVVEILSAWRGGVPAILTDPNREDDHSELASEAAEGSSIDANTVVFTTGSAGPPKGVRITTANWEASAGAVATHLGYDGGDVWVCALPLFHVGGLAILVRALLAGQKVILEPRFDPVRVSAILMEGQATLVSLVPTMLGRVLETDPGPYRRVRAVLVGGGPASSDLLEKAEAMGLPVLPTYGMSETTSQIATGLPGDRRLWPLHGVELKIVEGRIAVRGPMVSPGYFGEPDRSPDEWFVTSDLGEIAEDGFLRVLGRADDIIITGGKKVNPAEVEAVLRAHPRVKEAVVVGVPDPLWGEAVTAVLKGNIDPTELEVWMRGRIASYQIPKRWKVVRDIPEIGPGKPDRQWARHLVEGG
jgi:O-succinylbenzoic acid--CoA ligase